jgi:spoIIIJ-associated protein
MNRLFFSGRNLQQALLAAAKHFQIEPEEIAYSLRERQGGFIKNPRVVIEVDPAAPRRILGPPPVASAAVAPRPPRRAEPRLARLETAPQSQRTVAPEVARNAAAEAVGLLARLGGFAVDAEVASDLSTGELTVSLTGPGAPGLAANQGELLEPFEHLLSRLVRGMTGASLLSRVDAGGFRAAREAELRRLALQAAERVRREGLALSLPEMNPAERRIVHLALEEDPTVTTESHGEGFLKSVTVSPA